MGLSKNDIEHMRMGEYLDLFDNYKEIYNMHIERKIYIIPDRLDRAVSMLDMD